MTEVLTTTKANDEKVENLLIDNWLDDRVEIKAMIEKSATTPKGLLVTLVQRLEITLPNKERHMMSHSWIQKSEELKSLAYGTIVRFHVKVRSRVSISGALRPSLVYPRLIEVLRSPTKTIAPPAAAKPATLGPLEAIKKAKEVQDALGGTASLLMALDTVDKLGKDKLLELLDLCDHLGGSDKLRELVEVLK